VTRIIAGAIGSLQLKPAAKATRPTSDRVKESLFAKLDAMGVIEGAKVLDLFAGTGALGLESASRGAASVDLVERDRVAYGLLQKNVQNAQTSFAKQGLNGSLNHHHRDALGFLNNRETLYDLVFVDPPYEYSNQNLKALLEQLAGLVSNHGRVVVERSSRSDFINSEKFFLSDAKGYGDTAVYILLKNLTLQ
jgi:16S rRNA (guanine966-N2)-methyltransferase